MLTILMCKIAAFVGKLLGRGSSFPGALALKLDKNILGKLKLPGIVIAVTGSNGKTSTTEMIKAAADTTGKRVVCNTEGSNQIEGIATTLLCNCNFKKEVKADIIVLESDERFCQYTFKFFSPTHIIVTNLFRDQLTRNGNSEFVAGELRKGLPDTSVLIMNADEPISAALGFYRDSTIWFSVSAPELREAPDTIHAYHDGAFCPLCHARMDYDWHLQSHLGDYYCIACGFTRSIPAHAVTAVRDESFMLDDAVVITPQMPNMFFAYNIAAAYTVATEVFGLTPDAAAQALTNHTLSNKFADRMLQFKIGQHDGLFLLSKHENSMSYNGSLLSILASGSEAMTVVLIVDLLSRKYVANDVSWLWDVDFELLANDHVKRVLIGGKYANDVAARLLFAGVADDRIVVKPNLDHMMNDLYEHALGDVFLMTCFTDIAKFKKRLREDNRQ